MAVDVCSEASSSTASPRISFSHDLQDSDDIVPIQFQAADPFLFEPTIDFDFHFCTTAAHTLPADELFANGQILPVEIKKIPAASPEPKTPPRLSNSDENRKMLKEFLSTNPESDDDDSPPAKHFWQFRRSSSLNCDNRRSNTLVRSLQFLSRSNSTGSAPNPKPNAPPRASRKQRSKSEPFISRSLSSLLFNTQSHSHSHSHSHLNSSKKNSTNSSPLKKSSSCRSSGGHGVRISPVLNIPPNYISKTTFFGLGSLFCNGKSSKKKKR
ncbi:PREDICTED: probable membrane-associated kinase regulator 3 [Ipomoea nil]|uniref:probable membrane-associated kinase regulator 3 n=1 Tax=Ipomoea nil TaxID=35883 RepID=UPI0009020034|nr:PREDICTED: probable membrane-associated kinase regulator 3 [Ipomoea nil]